MITKPLSVFLVLIVAGCGVFWLAWEAPWGRVAVAHACEESGGTEILMTVGADGYFNRYGRISSCDCYYELGAGVFRYVDTLVQVHESRLVSNKLGYYRAEVVRRPDIRCDLWDRSGNSKHQNVYGLSEQECVAVYPIDEARLSQYESSVMRRQAVAGPYGVNLELDEHVIIHRPSGRQIASKRNFIYRTWLQRSLGDMQPSYQCDAEAGQPFVPEKFRALVFTNTNQEIE